MFHSVIKISTIAALIVGGAAHAQSLFPMVQYEVFDNAYADPEAIWTAEYLEPFGGENSVSKKRGAKITMYRAETPQGLYLLSQPLAEGCTPQLCLARLVKVERDGTKKVLVEDMMYIDGPFALDTSKKTLVNRDYSFDIEQ